MVRLTWVGMLLTVLAISFSAAGCGVKGPPTLPEKIALNAPVFNPMPFFVSSYILVDIVPPTTV